MKEEYAVYKTLPGKTLQWLKQLEPYAKQGICLDKSALLVLDMQDFFLSEQSHAFVPVSKAIIPNVKKLMKHYTDLGKPVFCTKHVSSDKGKMLEWWNDKVQGENAEITSELDLENTETIEKSDYSAFEGTDLKKKLEGMDSIVISGVMTHLCCESTARDAFTKGFDVYIVIDATASYNEDLHLGALKALSHGFAKPIMTGDVLARD